MSASRRPRLRLARAARRLMAARAGNMAVAAAMLLPLLAGVVGGAVDFAAWQRHRAGLQDVADAAALAATREASLKGWGTDQAKAVVDALVAQARDNYGAGTVELVPTVRVDEAAKEVTVDLEQDGFGYFVAGYFKSNPQIHVSARARYAAAINVCVIALEPAGDGAIHLQDASRITASDCAVQSASTSANGIVVLKTSFLDALVACSAGGYAGRPVNFSAPPLTDCPQARDPLQDRPAPAAAAPCAFTATRIDGALAAVTTLAPGVYCGGLEITNAAVVTLLPGIYVFRDGPLTVRSEAVVTGRSVGLHFTGAGAGMDLASNSVIDLTAPSTGEMAGLLMYQDRTAPEQDFVISSRLASNLLGTIYLPNGVFRVQTNNRIAERSAYTAIVAKRVELLLRPDLVLNTDYGATSVPVPAGLAGNQKGELRLVN